MCSLSKVRGMATPYIVRVVSSKVFVRMLYIGLNSSSKTPSIVLEIVAFGDVKL